MSQEESGDKELRRRPVDFEGDGEPGQSPDREDDKRNRQGSIDRDDGSETFDAEAYFANDMSFEEEEAEDERTPRRKWVRNTVMALIVAALFGNILAFWPQIYNRETLPFLFKSQELSAREDIQSYKEAVVLVSTDKGKGTGFHISRGYIVTNYHVIEGAGFSLVKFPGDDREYRAEQAGVDPALDIAILRVDDEGRTLPSIDIERERRWEAGDKVYVIGNPLYFTQIAGEGQVLGLVPIRGRERPAMAVDAPVFKGNSGSPVVNEQGRAIAVIYATGELRQEEGDTIQVGLAVPLGDVDRLLNALS